MERDDFRLIPVEHLSLEDGAATLTAFTAAAVARILPHLPAMPELAGYVDGERHATLFERRYGLSQHVGRVFQCFVVRNSGEQVALLRRA